MGGLTLYETLRILVPGILTTLSLHLALQVGFGPKVFEADGGVRGFVEFLGSTAGFTAFSLTAGLILYLIDIPVKLRIFHGTEDRPMPSETLREMLAGSRLEKDHLSLYFTLTDQYLPEEMRKRVYLFGSLYRIYVDLRVVLMTVTVGAMACSHVVARANVESIPSAVFDGIAAVSVLGIAAAIVLAGGIGVRRHAISSRSRAGDSRGLWVRIGDDARSALGPVVVLGSSGGLAALLLASSDGLGAAVGLAAALCQLSVWMMLEVGPPNEDETERWRDRVLVLLRARRDAVQYAAVQRLLFDLSLVLPWLVGATWANVLLDRDPAAVLAWSLLILPPVLVMSFRKHEERLLGIYREQSVWLRMHAKDIEDIRNTGLSPESWKKV